MRIAVDGRTIVSGRSGIGMYAERIMKALLRIDQENEYFLFLTERNDSFVAENLKIVLIEGYHRAGLNRWWENVLFPLFARRNNIKVLFSPANHLPLWPRSRELSKWQNRVRYVATIHDVITDILPETFTPKMRFWQKIFNTNAAKVADQLITVSESTARDFIRIYGQPRGHLRTVHSGVDEFFRPVKNKRMLHEVQNRYHLPQSFVLFVGTIEPRKNVSGLFRAYALIPSELRMKFPLVMVGGEGWYSREILSQISSLGLADSVIRLGYVSDKDLPALYTLATVFVFPSLYEGFGYPPLEAMSCGTPVISSNKSSIPEVVGGAAVLVDPHNVESLAQGLKRVLVSKRLRGELNKKGLRRARLFGWQQSAEQTLSILTGKKIGVEQVRDSSHPSKRSRFEKSS